MILWVTAIEDLIVNEYGGDIRAEHKQFVLNQPPIACDIRILVIHV